MIVPTMTVLPIPALPFSILLAFSEIAGRRRGKNEFIKLPVRKLGKLQSHVTDFAERL
jgi:hypothetical protein